MLQVMFINPIEDVSNGYAIPFDEAVTLTENLEKKNQKKKTISTLEFSIIDNEQEVYSGQLTLGAGKSDNLFHHIVMILDAYPIESEEEEQKKQEFYSQMFAQLPDHIRKREEKRLEGEPEHLNSVEDINPSSSIKSKMKQHMKVIFAAVFSVFILFFSVYNQFAISTQKQALAAMSEKLEQKTEKITDYKKALEDQKEKNKEYEKKMSSLEELDKKVQQLNEKVEKKKDSKKK
ncbi:hypothetical protein [Bacillus sp. FSL H8-0515]|uniref:hypothetical protein n=1 Tax=Bacillus sp. FSL H8-0515 TaxID=2921396 RepID=UPI0030FBED6F